MKIYKPRLQKCIVQRMKFYSVRDVYAWNCIPDQVVLAQTKSKY